MSFFLGIDLGTTGLKTVITNEVGVLIGTDYREYPISIPKNRYAEQDPEKWYHAMYQSIIGLMKKTGISATSIKCLGFAGQMHGLVMLDADKRLLYPSIIHCDGRASKQKQEIMKKVGLEKLGLLVQNQVHSGFQALSLMWMRENEPDIYNKIRFALLPKDFLRYRLTGEIATEHTDAGGTLMYDNNNMRWSREILEVLGIDKSILPNADHLSYEIAGSVTKSAAEDTGLAAGTLVAFGGGDQPMQAVGNGLLLPGSASVNIGTSGQVFVAMDKPLYDPLLRTHTFCHAPENTWYMMGAVLNASLAFNWFLENILGTRDFEAMDREAQKVCPGADRLVFLPYLTGERTPHMNEKARAAFIGLTLGHKRGDMVRAVLEGVAFSLRETLEILRELEIPIGRMIISGGGARSTLWRQIISDVLETPLYISSMKEQAAMGAILCAQVASGVYTNLEEACSAVIRYEPNPILPDSHNFDIYREAFGRYREAYAYNTPLFD